MPCRFIRKVIFDSFQIRENDHIIEFTLWQMVVIEKFIDQAVVLCSKLLLFFGKRYFA